jgi:hypothetical protein
MRGPSSERKIAGGQAHSSSRWRLLQAVTRKHTIGLAPETRGFLMQAETVDGNSQPGEGQSLMASPLFEFET